MIESDSQASIDLASIVVHLFKGPLYEAKKKSSMEKFKEKHGIVSEKADSNHSVHSIGFSEKEKKWWGWSHRAAYGFGVGHTVKEGHSPEKYIGQTAKNLDDAKKFAIAFAREVS